MSESVGKKAEKKIKEWLNRPDDGYSFDRLPDPMSGYIGQANICDFICYKYPYMYYIESKATEHDRFDFTMLTDTQRDGLYEKSHIQGCYGIVIVLFVSYQRAFILDIRDMVDSGLKSLNIRKVDKWEIPSVEIPTIQSRKEMLDYSGELDDLVASMNKKNAESL